MFTEKDGTIIIRTFSNILKEHGYEHTATLKRRDGSRQLNFVRGKVRYSIRERSYGQYGFSYEIGINNAQMHPTYLGDFVLEHGKCRFEFKTKTEFLLLKDMFLKECNPYQDKKEEEENEEV